MRRVAGALLIAVCLAAACSSTKAPGGRSSDPRSNHAGGLTAGRTPAITPEQERKIDSATPSPSCPDPKIADGGPGVLIEVLRVVDGCAVTESERVPETQVDRRVAELTKDPTVVSAGPVPEAAPNALDALADVDPSRSTQWGLDEIGIPSGPSTGPAGQGVKVAVIDSGIDDTHPDLEGQVLDRMHYTKEGTLDGDAVHGHGTHVAGIIAAKADNGVAGRGVAPRAGLIDVPIALRGGINPYGPSWIDGLVWAVNHGADIANLSVGLFVKSADQSTIDIAQAAVSFATRHGVTVVAAGGNCGDWLEASSGGKLIQRLGGEHGNDCPGQNAEQIPAILSGVIAVAAVDQGGHAAPFSSGGWWIGVAAPGGQNASGTGIVSTNTGGSGTRELQGSSQAAPMVAGVAALLRSQDPKASPGAIRDAIVNTARDIDPKGRDDETGAGEINAPHALEYLKGHPGTGTGIGGKAAPPPAQSTSLVIDVSSSMSEDAGVGGQTKIEAARRAAHDVTQLFRSAPKNLAGFLLGLVTFSDSGTPLVNPTIDFNGIDARVDQLVPDDDTNLGDGLDKGLAQILSSGTSGGTIVLLTDGEPTEGLSGDEIVSQIVPKAVSAHIKVDTVGFGTPGAIDEDLLKRIAAATGGQYSFADSTLALRQTFQSLQASAVGGNVALSSTGSVAQGQITSVGSFTVNPGVGGLEASLASPGTGSDMDIVLHDPKGAIVDSAYAHATVSKTNPQVVSIDDPVPGEWQFDVKGVSISGGPEQFAAVASTHGTTGPPASTTQIPKARHPRSTSNGLRGTTLALLISGGLVALVAAGAVGGLVVSRRRGKVRCHTCSASIPADSAECPRCGGPPSGRLRLRVVGGPYDGRFLDVSPGDVIGRGEDVRHHVDDPSVSRQHAQLVWSEGRWAILDLGSTAGVVRNGQAIERGRLTPGDVIELGETSFIVEEPGHGADLTAPGRRRG
jgi:subtilisin family serine protease